MRVVDGAAVLEVELCAGESLHLLLEGAESTAESMGDVAAFCDAAFDETVRYWRSWSERSNYQGRWREMVQRSALTLKLLTSRKYGSLVAAPTLGLPESIGGGTQLGLPLYVDPGFGFYRLCIASAWVHRGGGQFHAVGGEALRGVGTGRLTADHVRDRWAASAGGVRTWSLGRLPRFCAGPFGQRCIRSTAAGYLR